MQAQTIMQSILIHNTFYFFGALIATATTTATTATGKSAPNDKTTTRNTNESLILQKLCICEQR